MGIHDFLNGRNSFAALARRAHRQIGIANPCPVSGVFSLHDSQPRTGDQFAAVAAADAGNKDICALNMNARKPHIEQHAGDPRAELHFAMEF